MDGTAPEELVARHHLTTPTGRESRDLTTYDDWRGALVDDLLPPVADVTAEEWSVLWERALASHGAWDDAGRP